MSEKKTKKPGIVKWSVLTVLCAILLVASFVASSIAQSYATVVNLYLGTVHIRQDMIQ